MPVDGLSAELESLLSETSRLAAELETPAYLVGGAVRDLLLGRPFPDVDLAVDGDARALGRALAESLPATLEVHEAFGTASLRTADGHRVDLARLRREIYSADAALPQVFPGSLQEDLLRRDFTVNSMALALEELGYPELIDPSGGRSDLAARCLRVHHERSFLDDPTRILRGVRLEARLGFGFERQTERWAREAASSGVLGLLSSDRLAAELRLLFAEEADPAVMWRRLDDLRVLSGLGFEAAPGTPEWLASVRVTVREWRTRDDAELPVEPVQALLMAALADQPPARRGELAGRLNLRRDALDEIERLGECAAVLGSRELAPHRAHRTLKNLSAEALVLLVTRGGADCAAEVHRHVTEQRRLRLLIDGETLLRRGFAPGPRIGRALSATLDARLDGRIGPDQELAHALEALGKGEEE